MLNQQTLSFKKKNNENSEILLQWSWSCLSFSKCFYSVFGQLSVQLHTDSNGTNVKQLRRENSVLSMEKVLGKRFVQVVIRNKKLGKLFYSINWFFHFNICRFRLVGLWEKSFQSLKTISSRSSTRLIGVCWLKVEIWFVARRKFVNNGKMKLSVGMHQAQTVWLCWVCLYLCLVEFAFTFA